MTNPADHYENPDDTDPIADDETNDQAAVEEAPEEYGTVDDENPPGVPAPPDLENQNEGAS